MYTVLDLETTGLDYKEEQVIQIGAVKLNSELKIVGQFTTKVALDEGKELTDFITKLTGITSETLEEAVPEREALNVLSSFIGKDIVVAQFASFDLGFISGYKQPERFLCTKSIFNLIHPEEKAKLVSIVNYYGIPYVNHHNAMADVKMTIKALRAMKAEIEEQGDELLDYVNIITEQKDRPLNFIPDVAEVREYNS